MPALTDVMFDALRGAGYLGAMADMRAAFFKDQGIATWREYYLANGGAGHINDWLLATLQNGLGPQVPETLVSGDFTVPGVQAKRWDDDKFAGWIFNGTTLQGPVGSITAFDSEIFTLLAGETVTLAMDASGSGTVNYFSSRLYASDGTTLLDEGNRVTGTAAGTSTATYLAPSDTDMFLRMYVNVTSGQHTITEARVAIT